MKPRPRRGKNHENIFNPYHGGFSFHPNPGRDMTLENILTPITIVFMGTNNARHFIISGDICDFYPETT